MSGNPAQQALAAWQQAKQLQSAGRLAEADALFRRALAVLPRVPGLLEDYAGLAEQAGDWAAADRIWQAVAGVAPDRPCDGRRGRALLQLGRWADALPLLEQHARRFPADDANEANLATAYSQLGRNEDAAACLRRLTRRQPGYEQGQEALVAALVACNRREDVGAALADARARFPGNGELAFLEAEHLLKSGRYGEGFDAFGARWRTGFRGGNAARDDGTPAWDGEPFNGRLRVQAEQGLGDEILYAAMLPDLAQRHADTVVECDARLLPLFRRSFPALAFTDRQAPPVPADRCCNAGDLGRWFRRKAADFAAQQAWLRPDPARRDALRAGYLSRHGGLRLAGLSWRSAHPANGAVKSLQLAQLLPLLSAPGTRFIAVQYGPAAAVDAELAALREAHGIEAWRDPSVDATDDIDGLAAQLAALDLVVSTSNSTAHLAGALGVPTMVLLHHDRGLPWYWGYEGTACRWYPSLALLRCPRQGDWATPVAAAAARLAAR